MLIHSTAQLRLRSESLAGALTEVTGYAREHVDERLRGLRIEQVWLGMRDDPGPHRRDVSVQLDRRTGEILGTIES